MWNAYFNTVRVSPLDQVILVFGAVLLIAHAFGLAMRAQGHRTMFVQGLGRYRTMLLMLTEILPVLGLLGTVFGLMNTFASFEMAVGGAAGGSAENLSTTVQAFAPALSTTISGLLMIIPNLLLNSMLWLASAESKLPPTPPAGS